MCVNVCCCHLDCLIFQVFIDYGDGVVIVGRVRTSGVWGVTTHLAWCGGM